MKTEIDLVNDHVDDPTVREIYADDLRAVSCTNGAVMNLELTVRRPLLVAVDAPPKIRTHTAARIVVPVTVATHIMEQIGVNLEQQATMRTDPPAGLQIQMSGNKFAKPVKTYQSYPRFVAVLDVLGMKKWLERASPSDIANQMGKALDQLDEMSSGETVTPQGTQPGSNFGASIGTTQFSDTLLAWLPDDSWESFATICSVVRRIVRDALQNGVPLRGSIALGDAVCFAPDLRFVGPPIAEAYTWADCERPYKSVGVDITPATLKKLEARVGTHPGFDQLAPYFTDRGRYSDTLLWYDECLFLNHWTGFAAYLGLDPLEMFSRRQLPSDATVQLKIDQMMAFYAVYQAAKRARRVDFDKDPWSLSYEQYAALYRVRQSREPA